MGRDDAPGDERPRGPHSHLGDNMNTSRIKIRGGVATSVVIGRVLFLLSAAAGLVVAVVMPQRREQASNDSREQYVCPMHPQVSSGAPGDCPICNMALERANGLGQTGAQTVVTHGAVG